MRSKKENYGLGAQMMYGMGEFFNGGAFVIINTFFTVFLTNAIGLPAALAGTIPLVGKVWDAITDPIMGNITDRTTSKIGPKRLYILIGAFASSLTFILLWLPLHSDNQMYPEHIKVHPLLHPAVLLHNHLRTGPLLL